MKKILTALTILVALAAVAEAKPAKRPQSIAAAETAAANGSYADLGRAVAGFERESDDVMCFERRLEIQFEADI